MNIKKTLLPIALGLNILLRFGVSYSQDVVPKDYVTEKTTVSFVKSTPFNIAIKALNEFSMRLDKKVLIDPLSRTNQINVDVINLPWRTALNLIANMNNIKLFEGDNFIQLNTETQAIQAVTGAVIQNTGEVILNPVNKDLREVKISATFIEADRKQLREIGFNWGILKDAGKTIVNIRQESVQPEISADDIGTMQLFHSGKNMDFDAFVKIMESEDFGDIVANPSVNVADGRAGRVQIGQDFSIKQRDFAGNVTDKFVSAGIILTVTPNIYIEDSLSFIHLDVMVERSSVIPGEITTIINKSMANTELLLNNKEKSGIGGLYLTEESRTRNGVPILKKIPKWFFGLGYLFGYDRSIKTEKELIILLQAEILPTLEERLAAMGKEGNKQ